MNQIGETGEGTETAGRDLQVLGEAHVVMTINTDTHHMHVKTVHLTLNNFHLTENVEMREKEGVGM